MTIRPKALVQTAAIICSLMLFPGTALVQEQKEAPAAQQNSEDREMTQQQGASISPQEETPTKPETEQQGKLVVPTVPAENEKADTTEEITAAPRKSESSQYSIRPGDTLWDISNAFFRDPFLWPFIWKANPYITNPDLIYPDKKLEIPSLAPIERALQAAPEPKEQLVEKKAPPVEKPVEKPVETVQTEEVSPREGISGATVMRQKPAPAPEEATAPGHKLILPEDQPVPIIDKYAMLSAGYVDSLNAIGRIVRPQEEGKTSYGYGDIVYVDKLSAQTVNIGDKFLISAEENSVRGYGRLVRGVGILQIIAKDSPTNLTAKITLSFDTIETGNVLTPYQEPTLVYESKQKKTKDIAGYIIEVTEKRTINGQLHFVYLDKGNVDGVEPGDRFTVYTEHSDKSMPKKKIGEVQVFIVKERTSTAIVRRSADVLEKGNIVEFKK
jgi:hypothetical protein